MSTLYRKYRPKSFKEVEGQNHIKITLQHEIETDKLAHAYLFCGPRAVGKTTMARLFSKSINCLDRKPGTSEPCNKCSACLEISEGSNMDIIEIDAASQTGVDNVRENIISAARVSPTHSKYKVFIIDEVHMLSISAFNALLKVMEEPPRYVVFILCTTEIHKVPSTIISRCQRFDFKKISLADIVKKLSYIAGTEKVKIDSKILEDIARHSEGHMRDAESLLGQVISIAGKEVDPQEAYLVIPRSDLNEVMTLIELLADKDAGAAIALVNKLVNDGVNLKKFLEDSVEMLRKIMISLINPSLNERLGIDFGEHIEGKLSIVVPKLSVASVSQMIQALQDARNEIKHNFIIQLPTELAILDICGLGAPKASATVQYQPAAPLRPTAPPRVDAVAPKSEPAPSAQAPERPIGDLSFAKVMEQWNEVLIRVRRENHSLAFVLKACQPTGLEGSNICLSFKYKLHKDRLADPNICLLIEKVFRDVYGAPLLIKAVIDKDVAITAVSIEESTVAEPPAAVASNKEDRPDDSLMDNLLKTFGGRIVN